MSESAGLGRVRSPHETLSARRPTLASRRRQAEGGEQLAKHPALLRRWPPGRGGLRRGVFLQETTQGLRDAHALSPGTLLEEPQVALGQPWGPRWVARLASSFVIPNSTPSCEDPAAASGWARRPLARDAGGRRGRTRTRRRPPCGRCGNPLRDSHSVHRACCYGSHTHAEMGRSRSKPRSRPAFGLHS